jgi:hypothetical protein
VDQTWEPILFRWRKRDTESVNVRLARRTAGTRSAGPVIQ